MAARAPGTYVHEEMSHLKKGKHPGMSRKQAIAVGLSRARTSGVKVPRRRGGKSSVKPTRKH